MALAGTVFAAWRGDCVQTPPLPSTARGSEVGDTVQLVVGGRRVWFVLRLGQEGRVLVLTALVTVDSL